MNDDFRELKGRIRKLDAMLTEGGSEGHIPFAQAVSAVRRAVKHGDRTREPSSELRSLLERAESLGRGLGRG